MEAIKKEIMTITEAGREYKERVIATFAIRNWAKQGLLPTLKAGNRTYINRTIFEEFLATGDGANVKK
jgi:hypothetical protein